VKIIVTGGAGFIGSHIVDAYVRAGHRVAVLDNLSTGSKKNVNRRAAFYRADIRNPKLLDRIFKQERPEILNHHAALINVVESLREPVKTLETNVMGTTYLFEAFVKHGRGKKKVIFASSGGSIYGNPMRIPADEHTPPNPLSPYALSKLLAEQVIASLEADRKSVRYTILRYANVFGPRQKTGVAPIFARLIRRNTPPTIFGSGKKTRDYVYVGDVVEANVKALTRGNGATLNIGSGRQTSDHEVFRAIAAELGFSKNARYAPARAGEVQRIALSPRRAQRTLGWRAKISFREGIKRTLETTSA